MRTFSPGGRLSPPRVPRFQSRRTHLDAFQLTPFNSTPTFVASYGTTPRDWALWLGGAHVVAAAAAGAVAKRRGLSVPFHAAKTFAVGFLALVETCFKTAPPVEGEGEA